MLELSNISVGYGEKTVLRDVTLSFPKGMLTAIVGTNGSGKTTLLKTALGLLAPTAGSVLLDGVPLCDMTRAEIARRISFLAQSKKVPDMTVRDAVLHGRFPYLSYPRRYRAHDREIASAAMEKMGVARYADTPLCALSGGERQNAYIAMTLAQDTETLLLDEPTASLDVRNAHALLKTLKQLACEGRSVALVTHDLPLAFSFADTVAVVSENGLSTVDTPARVLASGAVKTAFGVELAYSDAAGYYYRYGI